MFFIDFRETEAGGEGGRNIYVRGTGDKAPNPDMCPERALSQRPFSAQDNDQPTEPHWPRCICHVLKICLYFFLTNCEQFEGWAMPSLSVTLPTQGLPHSVPQNGHRIS